jgi:hypothetical protein
MSPESQWTINKQKKECNNRFVHKDVIYDRWRRDSDFQSLVTNSLDNLNRGIYYGKDKMKPPKEFKKNGSRIFIENLPLVGAVEIPTTKMSVFIITICVGVSIIMIAGHYCGVF